jgi:hypothetical protein
MSEAWEPSLLLDRFGNIFIAARRASTNLAVAIDDRSPTMTRSSSWLWVSSDGGRTFTDLPGYPLDVQNHEWGYEGDFALDDAGHLYFVDQTYADVTVSRWTVTGKGSYSLDMHRPLLPTAQPVDDRPFLASHGNGKVFYIVNTGDATLNPFGRDGGDAYGAGRFSVYRSTDGGATFDVIGHSLRESGACRPAADPRAGSTFVTIACTNDGGVQSPLDTPHGRGTLWAYVSGDDGGTYVRYRIGDYNADAETYDWPLVAVGPDGDVWVLHIDADKTETAEDGTVGIVTNTLNLYHSSDRGRTWSRQNITPASGRYRWGTLAVSADGDLGIAVQHRPSATSPWHAYAASFRPGSMPVLTSIDEAHPIDAATAPEPPSELMGLAFAPDRSLIATWTRVEKLSGLKFRRIYLARSNAPATVKGAHRTQPNPSRPPSPRLPATGVGDYRSAAVLALLAAASLRRWLRRRPA